MLTNGPTVFIEYEGGKSALQRRVRTMLPHGIYLQGGDPIDVEIIHRPDGVKIDTDPGEAWLHEVCIGKVLCVIGPVSKAASIQRENEPSEWQTIAERLQRVVDRTGCTILLLHHTRKPSQQFGPPKKVDDYFNTARGSNSYMGAVDFAIGVQKEQEKREGMLFYLEREGESGIMTYDFEIPTLTIQPSDRPVTAPTAEDKAERVYALIEDNPGITRTGLAAELGCTVETIKSYLTRLGERIVEEGEGNATRTYQVAG